MKRKLNIEFEATFSNIDREKVRQKLREVGAKLIHPEFIQTIAVFHLPQGHEIKGGWLRVRKEYDKVTMSLKIVKGEIIQDQEEVCLKVDNFEQAILFLKGIGCAQKAYQQKKRESWNLDGIEITIDEWPFLEPFVEIEGKSEEKVREVSRKLGFDYRQAYFGAADVLISQKYNIPVDIINNHTPLIVFDQKNPFRKKIKRIL